jgi:hypothetical protein
MSDDATIEDEAEVEQQTSSSRPETKTGLLTWSYILEIGKLIFSFFIIYLKFIFSY